MLTRRIIATASRDYARANRATHLGGIFQDLLCPPPRRDLIRVDNSIDPLAGRLSHEALVAAFAELRAETDGIDPRISALHVRKMEVIHHLDEINGGAS